MDGHSLLEPLQTEINISAATASFSLQREL
jgi:hypothetical protein